MAASMKSDITPVETVYFQSVSGLPYVQFFAVAPEGTRIEHVFLAAFWQKVATTGFMGFCGDVGNRSTVYYTA